MTSRPPAVLAKAISVCSTFWRRQVPLEFKRLALGALQVGRNLTDAFSGFLRERRYLLMDRDSSFSAAFRGLLESAGVQPVLRPAQSPNCNAHLERFHGSFKREAADRMVALGEKHLRRVVDEYLVHYHRERNHPGLDGRIILPALEVGAVNGRVRRRQRLGGILNYYSREAA
jgi:putative transposase